MDIFKLVGSIFVDNEEANKSISKTDEKAQKTGSTFADTAKKAAAFGSACVGAATVAVGAVTKLVTSTSETADTIDKMSQKIGISTEAYQEWDYIMGQNGMSVDSLQSGMKSLNKLMESAAEGNAAAIETFDALGISITDENGAMKSQEQMLKEVINGLAGMEEGAERSNLAQQLLGKSASEMAPMLNQGAEAIDQLRDRSHELGLIMSEEAVSAGVKMGDTIDDIKRSVSAMGTELGSAAMPLIQDLLNMIVEYLPMIRSLFDKLAPVITQLLSDMLPPLMELAETLMPVVFEVIEQLLPPISQIASAILPVIVKVIQILLPPLMKIVEAVLPVALQLLDLLMPLLDLITPILTIIGDYLGKTLEPLLNGFMDILGNVINFVKSVFVGDWKSAWESVKDIFVGIFNLVPQVIENSLNGAITMINGIIDGINKISGKIGIPAIPNIPDVKLPRFAEGGIVDRPTTALIGEDGAEAVVPLENNTAWIRKVSKEMNSQNDGVMSAVLEVLQDIRDLMADGSTKVVLEPDVDRLFDVMTEKSIQASRMGRAGLAF